jgi:anti-sigma B factor antagonist
MMIEIETNVAKSSVVCRPTGDLDVYTAVPFRHVISQLMRPRLEVTIDLDRLEFIDACGVSALVGTIRRVRAAGGSARLINPNRMVERVLRLAGVDHLIETTADFATVVSAW